MGLRLWNQLPPEMRNREVRRYYVRLARKKGELRIIRFFDIVLSVILIALLILPGIIISCLIILDSQGSPIFFQERVKQYGESFTIYKFRTMRKRKAEERDNMVGETYRTTRIGTILRKYRLDEIPQLLNILKGDMTFVGTRPEVRRFVREYTNEMYATLLFPPGLTSNTSIMYKDEDKILAESEDSELEYIKRVLPEKMKYNLEEIYQIGLWYNLGILLKTIKVVLLKE